MLQLNAAEGVIGLKPFPPARTETTTRTHSERCAARNQSAQSIARVWARNCCGIGAYCPRFDGRLERKRRRKLNLARGTPTSRIVADRGCDFAKVYLRQLRIGRGVLRAIEDVEGVGPEAHLPALGNGNIPCEPKIKLRYARNAKAIAAQIAECPRRPCRDAATVTVGNGSARRRERDDRNLIRPLFAADRRPASPLGAYDRERRGSLPNVRRTFGPDICCICERARTSNVFNQVAARCQP